MAETLKGFQDGFQNVAQYAERFDRSLSHSSLSIKGIIASLVSADVIKNMAESAMNQSVTLKSLKAGYSALEKNVHDMVKQHRTLSSEAAELNEVVAGRLQLEGMTQAMAEERLANMNAELGVLSAQVQLKQRISALHPLELGFYAAIVSSATALYNAHQQINRSMIEANSTLADRVRLTRTVLEAQRLTGAEFNTTAEAAKDLVDYGYDLDRSMGETLKLVIQMRDGLGVSSRLGAELAVVYERQLQTSARAVADAMASVVNDTALAADQAGRLAVNIGRAVAMLKPGVNADLSAVVNLVGRYEGALQKLGGEFGGFHELLTKMTGPDGLLQAGVLGVSDPAFLRSEAATKRVIDSFANYAQNFLGDTQGWERAMRLQALSEMFGTTTAQVNLMIRAVEEANNARSTSITVEQRFNDQVRASADTLNRLKNSIIALGQQAAIPIMQAVTGLMRPVAAALDYLVKVPGAVGVVTVAFGIGALFAVNRLWSLTRAFMEVAAAAHIAATRIRAQAAANALSFIGPMAPATGPGSILMGLVRGLPGQIALGVGVALAAWSVGRVIRAYIDKKWGEESFQITELKQSYEESLRNVLRRQAATGDFTGVEASVARAREYMLRTGMHVAEVESRIGRQLQILPEVAGKARFTKEIAAGYLDRTPAEQRNIDVIEQGQASLIDLADKQWHAAHKQNELYKEQLRQEEKRQEEETRNRRLFQPSMRFDFFRGAYQF